MDIRHLANGCGSIVGQSADKNALIATGEHSGYVERTIATAGHIFIQRTYSVAGATYTRTFTNYTYNGVILEHYVPTLYYAPKFYGWAYYPWETPVTSPLAWADAPWWSSYGSYLSPQSAYGSGFAWLTDYILAQTLSDAYQQRIPPINGVDQSPSTQDGGPAADEIASAQSDTPITPELKATLGAQVQQQLAYENAAASGAAAPDIGDLPSALKPRHLFVVATSLDVTTVDEQTCALSAGDVLWLNAPPPDGTSTADLRVASSKRADCPVGVQITVSLQDLQEMHNNLRARIDAGLQELRAKQGTGGLPSAPETALAPPPRPVMADRPTIVDANVAGGQTSRVRHRPDCLWCSAAK